MFSPDLRDLQDVVNVFDGAESFRVSVQDTGRFQLRKAGLEVQFNRLGGPTFPAADLKCMARVEDNQIKR